MDAIHDETITLESLLEQGPELSSLPEVYLRVTELLDDPSATVYEIGEAVQTDPAISTRILTMVNSAYYGMPNRVSTISQAAALLGRDRIKQILIGSVLVNLFTDPEIESFSLQDFWQHSIKTAIIAKQLAIQSDDVSEPDAIFIAGLLHDTGSLVLADKVPLLFDQVHNLKRKLGQMAAEKEVLGFDHAELGAALMTQWGLPELLATCTGRHHDSGYSSTYASSVRLVYMANELSHNLPPMDDGEALDQLREIDNWQLAGIPVDQICYACQLAEEQLFDVMESLGMINMVLRSE